MTTGVDNPGASVAASGRFSDDPARTAIRVAQLDEYFTAQVLDGTDMICRDLTTCRRSATTDRFGRRRPDVAYAAGQLSHVGAHYDLVEDGRPLRILVVAMETGRPDENVTMPRRRAQLSASAAQPMSGRNPHMQGVMNALRVAVGRAPGGDRAGELLDMTGRADPVHLFDAYAMTNLRLCSAFRAGSTDSRGTRVMSSNCLRHFAATVRILEPTLCIVQGVEVARQVITLLTTAQEITPNLHRGLLAGTRRCWRRSPIPPHGVISVGAVSPPCPICTTPSSPPLPLPASCVAHGPTPLPPTRPEPVTAA